MVEELQEKRDVARRDGGRRNALRYLHVVNRGALGGTQSGRSTVMDVVPRLAAWHARNHNARCGPFLDSKPHYDQQLPAPWTVNPVRCIPARLARIRGIVLPCSQVSKAVTKALGQANILRFWDIAVIGVVIARV